ncbi:MAG: ATP-grasp domain-containing protein [Clostridium sp.]|nr:ATP-grasp domain-containing protein [Clostridium sp.]
MIKGAVIYNKEDANRNKEYIKWLIEEGKKKNLYIELILEDNIISKKDDYSFIINRCRNYNITKILEEKNLKVFNNYKFCLLGNDKLLAYDFVKSLGIDYPRVYKNYSEIDKNKKVLEKPKDGHGGVGIKILHDFRNCNFNKNVYQEYVEDYVGDIRFYIINNKIIHSIIRKPQEGSLISNFTKGGKVEIYKANEKDRKLINNILENIEIDFGGIDFLLLKNGDLLFNEFEDAVGTRMLSYLGINNTMELFLDNIVNKIKGREI